MNPQLKSLIQLQKIDNEIVELERGKAAIPQQIELFFYNATSLLHFTYSKHPHILAQIILI